ncbi:acyl-CoA dehydrogenase family protein (plasmid) [Aminobacter sp. BA135]
MKIFEQQNRRRQWSDDERMILEQVTRLAEDIIAPKAEHIDRTGEFPHDTLKALNDLGLNGIFVPEAYGGTPMSYRLYLEIVKTISEACASTGIIYATNYHAMKPLVDFGNEEQKARLLPRIAEGGLAALAITEASAGSDATGMKTSFKPDGDDIVINGGKLFITNGDVADLVLLFGNGRASMIPERRSRCSSWKKARPALRLSVSKTKWDIGGLRPRPSRSRIVVCPAKT